MSIFEYLKDRNSQKTFEETQSQAEKMFTSQKEAIKAIADSTGYAEIRAFWEREKDAAIQRFSTAAVDDPTARAMFTLADRFLKFLDVRIKG